MAAGSILLGLFGSYAVKSVADYALSKLGKSSFQKQLEADFERWAERLPDRLGPVTLGAFFKPHPHEDSGPAQLEVYARFADQLIPSVQQLQAALLEQWTRIARSAPASQLVPFFRLDAADAARHLAELARLLQLACANEQEMFQRTVFADIEAKNAGSSGANHAVEIKLALEKLWTKEFRQVGGVLLGKLRFHFDDLDKKTKFELLRGVAFFHVLQMEGPESARRFREAARQAPTEARGKACIVRAFISEERLDEAQEEVLSLVRDYPDDLELWALRVLLYKDGETADDLAGQGPAGALLDAKVLHGLGKVAFANGDRPKAYDYALKARDAGNTRVSNYLTMGNALLDEYELPDPWPTPPSVTDEESIKRLRRAIAHFDQGLRKTIGAPFEEPTTEQIVANKTDALTWIADPGVGDWLRTAREMLPNSQVIRRGYGLWLANNQALSEGIELLNGVAKATQSPQAWHELGVLLSRRGDTKSLERSAAAALQVLAESPEAVETWLRAAALRLAVTTLLSLGELEQASDVLDGAKETMGHEAALLGLDLAKAQGGDGAERSAALAAADSLVGELDPRDAATLVVRLAAAEEFAAAKKVVDGVAEDRRTELLDRYSVYCTARLGNETATLELARTYRERHGFNEDVLHTELDALEGDPSGAADLMAAYLRENADDRLVWLRRSSLGLRHARLDWVEKDLEKLPVPETCHPQNGRAAAQLLATAGEPDRALEYAFRLFRAQFESGEAREALRDVVFRFSERPNFLHPEVVAADCAVVLQADHGVEYNVVLESGPNPILHRDEYPPDADIAKAMLGRSVGDTVALPSVGAGARTARIASIQDKHVYWAQELSQPTPTAPAVPGAMQFIPIGKTPEEVLATVHSLLAENREGTASILNLYRDHHALSLHGIAERLGKTTFETVLQLYGDTDEITKTPGENTLLANSVLSRGVALDDTALASLVFIEAHESLVRASKRICVGPKLGAELRRLPSLSRLNREHSQVSLDAAGEVVMTPVSEEQRATALHNAKALSVWAANECEERAGVWEEIQLAPRRRLQEIFGASGLEAVAVARTQDLPLATDDLALAMLARAVGVTVVSSLDMLRWFGQAGILRPGVVRRKRLMLAGAGYLGVSFRADDAVWAGISSEWEPTTQPLRDCFRLLFNRHISTDGRIPMALALVRGAFQTGASEARREHVVATALWSIDVLGVGDQSFTALVNMARSALEEHDRVLLDRIVARRQEIIRSRTRGGLILARS